MARPAPTLAAVHRTARVCRALLVLLVADAVVAWVVVLGVVTFVHRVWLGLGERLLPGSTIEAHVGQLVAARRLHAAVWLATAAVFLVWLRRVCDHVRAVEPGLAATPRAAVAAFLVPVVNLVAPVRVVRSLWRATGEEGEPGGDPPAWIAAWWALLVGSALLDPAVARLGRASVERLAVGRPTLLLLVALLAEIAAAVLAVVIAWRLDQRLAVRLARRGRA